MTRAKGTAVRTSGLSLIELLVVVAIIGILGGVGIVGYQAYISQTQDATTKDNFEFLKRTLDQDTNLTVDSTFTLEVSQDGSSNWISLGGADAPSTSLTVPANVTGSDELNALTNPQTATYRVTSGGASVTATCP